MRFAPAVVLFSGFAKIIGQTKRQPYYGLVY